MKEATVQQKKFINLYLEGRKRNATKAAIDAGYSPKSASSQASQLLKKANVKKYLKEKEAAIDAELRQEFKFDALEARNVMYLILNNPESEDRDRINVAKDFLDRAGFKPQDRQQIEHKGEISNGPTHLLKDILEQLEEGSNNSNNKNKKKNKKEHNDKRVR